MNHIEPLIQAYFDLKTAQDSAFSAFTPAIQAAILRKQKQHARVYLATFIGLFVSSLGGLVWSSFLLVHQALAAGLGQLLSMGWTDFSTVSQFWSDFLISIGESLPVTTIMICLAAALAASLTFRAAFATYEVYFKELKVYGKN